MKLSRKTFSRKIQEKILGDHLEYASNLCSQFWMTVFAISCVTIFLPITALVLGIGSLIEGISKYRISRRENLQKHGRKLTTEQAFNIARSAGLVYYTRDGIKLRRCELSNIYSYSNKKAEALLYGWMRENWQNYDSDKPDGVWLLEHYIRSLESKATASLSVKKLVAGARTTAVSYVPTMYWTLGVAGAIFILSMTAGVGWAQESTGSGIGIGLMLALFWLVIFAVLYFGGDCDVGLVQKFVNKYGEPLQDDIFISYLKAVKHKMCPLIEWTD